jgi:PadR family transcriptional regulator PadR
MGVGNGVSLEVIILALLAGRREHYGLEILETLRVMTKGRKKLSLGSLYTTLHRMEQKNLVESRWGDERSPLLGARRRYYRTTSQGEQALKEVKSLLADPPPVTPSQVARRRR